MSKTIFLLRHGQTLFNAQQRLQGHCNSNLTPLGCEQATRIGQSLKTQLNDKTQWKIYSSPLGRAMQTATIVAQQIGLDPQQIIEDPRLQEFCLGDWEKASIVDIHNQHPQLCERKDWYLMAPNAESFAAVYERVNDFINDPCIAEQSIVVSHGLTGIVFRGAYTGMSYQQIFAQDLPQDAYFLLADNKINRIECSLERSIPVVA